MKKQLLALPFIVFLVILLTFFYLLIIERNPSSVPSALLGKKIPYFETESLIKKEKFNSHQELKNEVILVNFFASWCKPCKDEHEFIKNFKDKQNLKIIGINYKDDSKKVLKWLKELGNPYSNIAIDQNGKIAIDWGVYGIPETFIVSSEGIVKFRHVGQINKKVYEEIILLIEKIVNE